MSLNESGTSPLSTALTCGSGEADFYERKSHFIGYMEHVSSEEEARAFLETVKELHPEASHHVWCYILAGGAVVRSSDDGEPSGTAGRPVAEVMLREQISDCICVAVRYFGGILLGAGGLIRAYAQTARIALEAAGICKIIPLSILGVEIPYSFFGKISFYLKNAGIEIENSLFTEKVSFHIALTTEELGVVKDKLTDMTSGTAVFYDLGMRTRSVPAEKATKE